MLIIVIIALIVLIFIWIIHSRQHFKFKLRTCSPYHQPVRRHTRGESAAKILEEQIEILATTRCNQCCFDLRAVNDEEFDFFPVSFLFYLLFMIFLYILIIIAQILSYSNGTNNETMSDLFFSSSVTSYHKHSVLDMHHFTVRHIIDYILIYCVLILFLWTSLFSFYRYYSTFISTTQFQSVSTKQLILFSRFRIYALVFSIMFILQIHFYYYLFPINIILFCSFNFFCTYKFAEMLVKQFKVFQIMSCNELNPASNEDVLQSVRFSKYISFICSGLHSLSLCLFVVTYNITIIYYLPILFDIAAIILSSNFVRNRLYFRHPYLRIKHCCKCICYKTVKVTRRQTTPSHNIQSTVDSTQNIDSIHSNEDDDDDKAMKIEIDENTIKDMIENEVINSKPSMVLSKSADECATNTNKFKIAGSSSLPLDSDEINMCNSRTSLKVDIKMQPNSIASKAATKAPRKQKALELLGIPHTPSYSIASVSLYKPGTKTPSRVASRLGSKMTPIAPSLSVPKQTKSSSLTLSQSDSDEEQTPEPQSAQIAPIAIPITSMTPSNAYNIKAQSAAGYDADENGASPYNGAATNRAKSAPVEEEQEPMDEVMISLQLLAKYGFCSRDSILAMKQLNKYQKSLNTQLVNIDDECEADIEMMQ